MISSTDIEYYLHIFISRLKRTASQIDLENIDQIREFQKLLVIDEQFLNFLNSVICAFRVMKLQC